MYHIIIFEEQNFFKIAHVSDLARAEIKTFRSNFWDNVGNRALEILLGWI